MRRFVPLFLGLLSTTAQAQVWLPNVEAPEIWWGWFVMEPGQTVLVRTKDSTPGADPMLIAWDPVTRTQITASDDADGVEAVVSWNNPYAEPRTFFVYLLAAAPGARGTTDVWFDGTLLVPAAPVDGARHNVACQTSLRQEVILRPGGAADPILLGFDAAGTLVATDDNSGVGLAPRTAGGSQVCSVTVGVAPGIRSGRVSIAIHNQKTPSDPDVDEDGLNQSLEDAIGTCDTPMARCAGNNPKDSDRDGIPDGYEVLGIDDGAFPQLLPAWGADPLHKDVFIQVDYADTLFGQQFTEEEVRAVVEYYDEGPAADLDNPDGLPGIAVHMDVGVEPSGTWGAGVFGDWGGSGMFTAGSDYNDVYAALLAPIRRGIFREAAAAPGGGGQANGDHFGWGVPVGDMATTTFAHELGHTMTLSHWGHDEWGISACKPHYVSLMSYAYGWSAPLSSAPGTIWLNPSRLSEADGIFQDDTSALPTGPFALDVSGRAVDWNRDARFEAAGTPVRAAFWAPFQSCRAFDAGGQQLWDSVPPSTPALTRYGSRLYALRVDSSRRIWYRQGEITLNDSEGSCPGGDTRDSTCMSWSTATQLAVATGAEGVNATTWGPRLYISYRAADNTIRVVRPTTFDGSGNIQAFTETTIAGSSAMNEPELAVMSVNPSLFNGANEVLAVIWRQRLSNTLRWATMSRSDGTWTDRGIMRSRTGNMTGSRSPTLATSGSGASAQTCGAFTIGEMVRVYCYNRTSGQWVERQGVIPEEHRANTAKAGFAFHINRASSGLPIRGDTTEGQFILTTRQPDGTNRLMISSRVNSTIQAGSTLEFPHVGDVRDIWSLTPTAVGVEMYEDPSVTALKALHPWTDAATNEYPDVTYFYPLFDGSVDLQSATGSDWQLLERGLCLGVRDETWCGNRATSVNGY